MHNAGYREAGRDSDHSIDQIPVNRGNVDLLGKIFRLVQLWESLTQPKRGIVIVHRSVLWWTEMATPPTPTRPSQLPKSIALDQKLQLIMKALQLEAVSWLCCSIWNSGSFWVLHEFPNRNGHFKLSNYFKVSNYFSKGL